jgi:hypothetical protein
MAAPPSIYQLICQPPVSTRHPDIPWKLKKKKAPQESLLAQQTKYRFELGPELCRLAEVGFV